MISLIPGSSNIEVEGLKALIKLIKEKIKG